MNVSKFRWSFLPVGKNCLFQNQKQATLIKVGKKGHMDVVELLRKTGSLHE